MQTPSPISALVVDDEPPARRRLLALLEEHPDFEVVGEADSGKAAVEAIRLHEPRLVFLDVQMPEGDGFEVIESVGAERMPVVVFVTAYDEYAVRAFETHALDYLLKPYDRDRFAATLDRARDHLRRLGEDAEDERLLSLARAMRAAPRDSGRLAVRNGSRTRLLELASIDYLEAETNYVRVHAGGQSYLIRDTMTALEARLEPGRFLRVHRSLIVNLARVVEIESLFAGEYILFLRDGTRLTTGRSYRPAVQSALGLA